MSAKITIQQKKDLIERVRELNDPTEHRQLLRVILKNKVNFTENDNGCFTNLAAVSDNVIKQLLQVVEMCEKNREYHETMNSLLEEARKNVDTLYEKKLDRKKKNNNKQQVKDLDSDTGSNEEDDNDDFIEESDDDDDICDDGNGPDNED